MTDVNPLRRGRERGRRLLGRDENDAPLMRGKAGSARQTNESRAADDNAANDREKVAPNFGGDANLCESECRVKPRDGRRRRNEEGDRVANRR